jgi:hypothetical protein
MADKPTCKDCVTEPWEVNPALSRTTLCAACFKSQQDSIEDDGPAYRPLDDYAASRVILAADLRNACIEADNAFGNYPEHEWEGEAVWNYMAVKLGLLPDLP